MKKRSQDKPQNKMRVAKKRARLVEIFAEGKTVRQAAKQLKAEGFTKGTSIAVVGKDLQALSRTAIASVEEVRVEAYAELQSLKNFVMIKAMMRDKEAVDCLLSIHDRIARLLGLDAPAKSINANVTAPPGLVAMDFSTPVERTPNLVGGDQEYLDTESTAKALKAIEE